MSHASLREAAGVYIGGANVDVLACVGGVGATCAIDTGRNLALTRPGARLGGAVISGVPHAQNGVDSVPGCLIGVAEVDCVIRICSIIRGIRQRHNLWRPRLSFCRSVVGNVVQAVQFIGEALSRVQSYFDQKLYCAEAPYEIQVGSRIRSAGESEDGGAQGQAPFGDFL